MSRSDVLAVTSPRLAGLLAVAAWQSDPGPESRQTLFRRLSDPLVNGSDLLGTGSWTPSTALVEPTLVACVMVASVVGGHVLGVVLAHDRAVRLFPRRAAAMGQVPLMVLMITLTCLGLFLLFSD